MVKVADFGGEDMRQRAASMCAESSAYSSVSEMRESWTPPLFCRRDKFDVNRDKRLLIVIHLI